MEPTTIPKEVAEYLENEIGIPQDYCQAFISAC